MDFLHQDDLTTTEAVTDPLIIILVIEKAGEIKSCNLDFVFSHLVISLRAFAVPVQITWALLGLSQCYIGLAAWCKLGIQLRRSVGGLSRHYEDVGVHVLAIPVQLCLRSNLLLSCLLLDLGHITSIKIAYTLFVSIYFSISSHLRPSV